MFPDIISILAGTGFVAENEATAASVATAMTVLAGLITSAGIVIGNAPAIDAPSVTVSSGISILPNGPTVATIQTYTTGAYISPKPTPVQWAVLESLVANKLYENVATALGKNAASLPTNNRFRHLTAGFANRFVAQVSDAYDSGTRRRYLNVLVSSHDSLWTKSLPPTSLTSRYNVQVLNLLDYMRILYSNSRMRWNLSTSSHLFHFIVRGVLMMLFLLLVYIVLYLLYKYANSNCVLLGNIKPPSLYIKDMQKPILSRQEMMQPPPNPCDSYIINNPTQHMTAINDDAARGVPQAYINSDYASNETPQNLDEVRYQNKKFKKRRDRGPPIAGTFSVGDT